MILREGELDKKVRLAKALLGISQKEKRSSQKAQARLAALL